MGVVPGLLGQDPPFPPAADWGVGDVDYALSGLSAHGGGEQGVGEAPFVAPRIGRGHGQLDAPHADPDLGADLEQLEADGAAGGLGELGVAEADAAQGAEQHIGHRGEPQAELVGAHGGGRRAVGEEVALALLDAVFHLAASAVDLFVEVAGAGLGGFERGDDEAGVFLAGGVLGLGDDPAPAAPAVERRPHEVVREIAAIGHQAGAAAV